MKAGDFNKVMNEFYSFKKRLIEKIKTNINKLLIGEDCYIVNEIWNNKLEKYFNQYKIIEERNKSNYLFELYNLINEEPEIIANSTTIISLINNNNKFKIIGKNLFKLLYNNKYDLTDCNYAKYYAGNNKLIIEFQGKNEDKALLLIHPLGIDNIKKNLFIIIINYKDEERKLLLYKNLINLKNINELNEYKKHNDNVIPLDKYNNSIKQRKLINNNNFKRDILKILIYIFYYEKPTNEKDNIINIYLEYYLINLEWLKAFKEFYDYQNLYTLLKKDKKYNNLKFHLIESQIETIMNEYINKFIPYNKIQKLNEYLSNISNIQTSLKNKVKDLTNIYVIHSTIIDIIKPYLSKREEIIFKPINFYFKENKYFFYINNDLIIGNINENHQFITEIIISYNNLFILEKEKKLFENNKFNEYIKYRNCNINTGNKQALINENQEQIGQLIILSNKNKPIDYKEKIQTKKGKIKEVFVAFFYYSFIVSHFFYNFGFFL